VSRATTRQISFADWELMQHGKRGVRLEPQLTAISDFLDEQEEIIECIRRDLVRGLKKPGSGRSGLTPIQILRSLVLMRLKSWDYRELRERIADGLTLRQFTEFYCASVPKHDAFQRSFVRLTPHTLKAINDLVVQSAVELGLEDGAMLRFDTTVVQTDIHHPTDNTLLWDVVRVVTRLVRRLAKALELRTNPGFLRSQTFGASPHVRDPAHDDKAAPGATDRDIPGAHRHYRRGRRERASGARKDPQDVRQGCAQCHGHRRTAQTDRALLPVGQRCDRTGTSPRAQWRAGCQ
jgi:hypothetical protein